MEIHYTAKATKALSLARKYAKDLQHGYVGTEHLLLGLLKEGTGVAAKVLSGNHVQEEKLLELIKQLIAPASPVGVEERDGYTPRTEGVIRSAKKEAERFRSKIIGTEHLLLALVKETDCVGARLLNTIGINIQKVYVDTLVAMGEDGNLYKEEFQNGKPFKKKKERTPTLNQFSRDLTALAAEGKLDVIIGREREITRVIQILSRRTKNNPCLIGEPGVGKTAIAEGLARRIVEGSVPPTVQGKRVVTLDLSGMVAGSNYRGECEERIKRVIKEVIEDRNVLLFLDELHTIIGAGGAEGAIDASNILKPSLARGEVQLIGATTLDEYRKYIEKDAALERRFQPVTVEEPTKEETLEILQGIKDSYEKHHGLQITQEALWEAVGLSARYINDRFLPDKAIDLIDEASSKVRLSHMKVPEAVKELEMQMEGVRNELEESMKKEDFIVAGERKRELKDLQEKYEKLKERNQKRMAAKKLEVTAGDIADVVSMWTKIPVQRLAEEESAKLLRLENTLKKRVIGQDEAVNVLSKAIKRGRVGLKDPKRPIGSFLFLGPTGVGKTELSKALAEALFGTEDALIRVDMSEYMEKHSVSKMIGSPPGYVGFDEGGQLSEKIRRNPYSVILFDEVEKAHPDVFNVLLQVLDDGHMTDAQGRKVSFKNTVVIMTSNAGASRIIDPKKLGFTVTEDEKQDYEKMKSGVMEEVKQIFKPEFINRIDEILVFHTLNKGNMKQIVTLLVKGLIKRAKDQMDIHLHVTENVKDYIVEKGTDSKYGARPLRRAVQNLLEDPLTEEILNKRVKPGDEVTAGMGKKELKFSVK